MARLPIFLPRVAAVSGAGCRSYDAMLTTAAWSVVRSSDDTECAETDQPGSYRVSEQNRPLLLVVCGDEAQLASVRRTLRAAGFLCTSGRSVEAALSLLTQVRVDGCVVAQALDTLDSQRLRDRLEQYNPGCVRVCLTEANTPAPEGWPACNNQSLPSRLQELFR